MKRRAVRYGSRSNSEAYRGAEANGVPSIRRRLPIVLSLSMLLPTMSGVVPAGAAWLGNGVPLCTETHDQVSPVIVGDGAHGAIVVWEDYRISGDIYAQRVNASGVPQWSTNGVAVCAVAWSQSNPVAVSHPGGGSAIFWKDNRSGTNWEIYGQLLDGTGVGQWAFNGLPLAKLNGGESIVSVGAISDGSFGITVPRGWIVLWTLRTPDSEYELRLQHIDATGAGLWTPSGSGGQTLADRIHRIGSLDMASDGAAGTTRGAVVAWSESYETTAETDVHAGRVDASGIKQWNVAICDLPGSQDNVDVVSVGSGLVVAAWDDFRAGDRDLYAQKLNLSGVPQWLADGLPICRASGWQTHPKLLSDLAGGVFATWNDFRSGTSKVYAQRLDANGQPMWAVDGIPLCSASGSQNSPALVGDGAGGIIVAWADRRDGNIDIYAQRVDGSGNLLWPAGGVPLVSTTGQQIYMTLAGDGESGAIAAWVDDRAGNEDIYANRVYSGGGVVSIATTAAPRTRLSIVSSNPSRGAVRLSLELSEAAVVTGDVIDISGRAVRRLLSGVQLGPGAHGLVWDGASEGRARVAAGVYFVCVRSGQAVHAIRVVRLE